jgi:hypothetical protein
MKDWAQVKSLEAAQALARQGLLFKILLFPAELGGEDVPPNTVYVPRGIPESQAQIVDTVSRMVEDGLADQMTVNAEYKGDSFVPAKIHMKIWDSSGRHGAFEPVIAIW